MEPLVIQTCVDHGRIRLQTIFEEEEPPAADNKQLDRSTKVCTLFLYASFEFNYLL